VRVALTDEQQMVRETAERLAASMAVTVSPPANVAPEPAEWATLAATGFIGLGASESDGTAVDAVLVVESLARNLVAAPYLTSGVLVPALLHAVDASAAELDSVTTGQVRLGVALDEHLEDLGDRSAGDLLGVDAQGADAALVFDGRTPCVVSVTFDEPIVEQSVDLTRCIGRVAGDRTSVVQKFGSLSPSAHERWLALAIAAVCADLVGVMRGALDLAVQYARDRHQFGVPIGSFQAVQQLLARQLVLLESARPAVWYAAWASDHLASEEALAAARTAKVYCSDAAREVTEACIQVHGGIGVTWECLAHVFLRRAMLGSVMLGDSRHHLMRLAAIRYGNR
jgi:alkylation response protein AidB-like acyl-CoA dehydrogenase